jgi:hypothetical protein
LWAKWFLGSRSEESGAHVLKLLAQGFATLFFDRRMGMLLWSPIWRRLSGNFG